MLQPARNKAEKMSQAVDGGTATIAKSSATSRPDGAAADRPLSGDPQPFHRLHPDMYAAEMVGTALLIAIALSIVIALWGKGGPLAALPLTTGGRRLLNGLLGGSVGAVIAYSRIGKISGAHINPAMTLAFWLEGKLQWRDAGCYIVAQVLGGALGAATLLIWGSIGTSAAWGATVPGAAIPLIYAVCGEVICTFAMVSFVFLFASKPSTQPYTPLVNPPLFAILSWLEASVSGASANPVRSLAPELVGWAWSGWWIYWAGPALGAALAVGVFRYGLAGRYRPHQARMCHFGHPGGTLHP